MIEITGTPMLDWLLTQAPVTVVLAIAAWRLEALVRALIESIEGRLSKCQDFNEALVERILDQELGQK